VSWASREASQFEWRCRLAVWQLLIHGGRGPRKVRAETQQARDNPPHERRLCSPVVPFRASLYTGQIPLKSGRPGIKTDVPATTRDTSVCSDTFLKRNLSHLHCYFATFVIYVTRVIHIWAETHMRCSITLRWTKYPMRPEKSFDPFHSGYVF